MASLFDKISKEMTAAGIRPRTETARSWILDIISKIYIILNQF